MWRVTSPPPQLPRCAINDVSSQLNLQQHLPWSSGYLGYLAFTINLALGVKQGPGEEEDTGRRRRQTKGQQGSATLDCSLRVSTPALPAPPSPCWTCLASCTPTSSSISCCSHLCTVSLYLAVQYTQFTLASHSCLTTIPCPWRYSSMLPNLRIIYAFLIIISESYSDIM